MGIRDSLGEYFFGSRTRRAIEYDEFVVGKFVEDQASIAKARRAIREKRVMRNIYYGKYFPFLLELGSIYTAARGVSEESASFLSASAVFLSMAEVIRIYASRDLREKRESARRIVDDYKKSFLEKSPPERNRLEDSGAYPERN